MKFLKALSKKENFWPLLLVMIAGILASRTLIFQKGYFNMHDDLQMMRQLQMEKCFLDLQIPCRWVPDMGYGFGFPLFNFYPPLPYLIGELFRLIGLSFVVTAKLTFALSFIVSGVGMYYLAKEFFGRVGGIVSAIFYVWAPYHAVDVYVRGAMNESWGLVFFPFIFYFGYKLISEKKNINKWLIGLMLAYFGLFTSHNLMILIFTPVFIFWSLMWMKLKNSWNRIPHLALAGIGSLGLSAYFTIPAIAENKLTWLKSQLIGYYDYTAHFVTLKQLLISRFWDYGPSVWLEYDRMSFQAGHVHWLLSLVIFALVLAAILKNRKKGKKLKIDSAYLIIIFLFVIGWIAAFMTHVRSTPIYQAIPILALVQFSWRFLTLVTFAFSFMAGAVVLFINKLGNKYLILITSALTVGLIIFNWNYFLPEHGKMGKLTDQDKFSAAAWDLQQTAGIYDYLPGTAKEAPKGPQKVLAEIMAGGGNAAKRQDQVSKMEQGTDWARFSVNSDKPLKIRIGIFQFPNWEVTVDDKKIETFMPVEERWGRMWIEVPEGEHVVVAEFKDTPIRTFSNILSLLSWLGLVGYLIAIKKKK